MNFHYFVLIEFMHCWESTDGELFYPLCASLHYLLLDLTRVYNYTYSKYLLLSRKPMANNLVV